MSNQPILEYVEAVIARIAAPEEYKARLKNELKRYIITASEGTSIDEVTNKLGSPEELADKMSRKLANEMTKELHRIFNETDNQTVELTTIPERKYIKPHPAPKCRRRVPQRYRGEFTREESRVNIKLLYIPLIQISSGVEKRTLFFDGEDVCGW